MNTGAAPAGLARPQPGGPEGAGLEARIRELRRYVRKSRDVAAANLLCAALAAGDPAEAERMMAAAEGRAAAAAQAAGCRPHDEPGEPRRPRQGTRRRRAGDGRRGRQQQPGRPLQAKRAGVSRGGG